jgi:hypothetical protein
LLSKKENEDLLKDGEYKAVCECYKVKLLKKEDVLYYYFKWRSTTDTNFERVAENEFE